MFCSKCGGQIPGDSNQCPQCGIQVAGQPAGPHAIFQGSGLLLFGWGLLTGISSYLIIPAGYAATAAWKWFLSQVVFDDGTRLEYHGKVSDVWAALAISGVLMWISVIPQIAMQGNPALIGPVIFLNLAVMLVSVAIGLYVMRKFFGGTHLSSGQVLRFDGTYWPYVGYMLLYVVSVYTIIGWAWVLAAFLRWFWTNVKSAGLHLDFKGQGHEILWRMLVFVIFSIPIITLPWSLKWIYDWMISKIIIVKE